MAFVAVRHYNSKSTAYTFVLDVAARGTPELRLQIGENKVKAIRFVDPADERIASYTEQQQAIITRVLREMQRDVVGIAAYDTFIVVSWRAEVGERQVATRNEKIRVIVSAVCDMPIALHT